MLKLLVFLLGFLAGAASMHVLNTRVIQASPPSAPATPAPMAAASPAAPATTAPSEPGPHAAPPGQPVPSEPFVGAEATPSAPAEAGAPEVPVLTSDLERLRARALILPLQGFDLRALRDTFAEGRDGRRHEAIDLLAPRGTPVVAVDDGPVAKLFTSERGGLTVYQFDRNGEYCYYYAHLDRYAEGLAQGAMLRKGDRLGYVGTSGNAPKDTPHLHFTIFRLGPEKRWWEGTPINAYLLWASPSAPAAP
jgi:murein DD-endopeptidase MepM/ murein hydrolase activator NlpD